MPEYFEFNDDHVPKKLGFFVGGIALLGAIGGGIFIYLNYKPLPEYFDPSDPNAFGDVIQNDAAVQETTGLWTPPRPPDDVPDDLRPMADPFEKIRNRKSAFDQDPFGKKDEPTSQPG